jgi:hypothetical protein
MKNFIWVLSLMVVLASPLAEASRSRLSALGQSEDGSLFINDARNVFLNPAWVNKLGNQVNLEWGRTASNLTPKAEGGLVANTGNLNYGAQLGRVDFAGQDVAGANTLTGLTGLYFPQNSLEVIVGREGEFTWGGALHYVNSDEKRSNPAGADEEVQIITGKFGMMKDNFQGFVHLDLKNDASSETAGVKNEYGGDLTLRLGGSMDLDADSNIGANIARLAHEFDNAGADGEREVLSVRFDYYRNLKASETDLLYYTIGLRYYDDEAKFDAGGNQSDEALALPLVLGLETKTKEWLTLRGSVRQEVLINKQEEKTAAGDSTETNNADDTVVAAGLGLTFGSLSFDATFEGSTTNGEFDADDMFGFVGMNYSF